MATVTHLMTADELYRLPDNGTRTELVRGELITMAPAGFEHGAITFDLSLSLAQHVAAQKLGRILAAETGFLVERNPDTVRAADIAFVCQEKLDRVGMTKKFFPEAPDAAVEVLSPSDTVDQVDEKVQQWLAAGCKLVWLINPRQRTVTVHRPDQKPVILTETDYLDGGDVISGFRIQVRDVFPSR